MSLIGHQMKELPPIEQAEKAIAHALTNIRQRPEVGWYCGIGTQTFALLTEAYAALLGEDYDLAFAERFECKNARNPAEGAVPAEEKKEEPIGSRRIMDAVQEMSMVQRQELLDDLLRDFCRCCGSRTIIKPCGCVPARLLGRRRKEVAA